MRRTPALPVGLLVLALSACTATSERTVLTQFFAASRLRDLTALGEIATVVFEPHTDGIVTDFDVRSIVAGPTHDDQASEDVSISARVKLPDGQIVDRVFDVAMQRRPPGPEANRWGPWMISGIKAVPAGPSTQRR